ncbi:hypothetical protein L9F63_019665, partial [Diploptera punctata]
KYVETIEDGQKPKLREFNDGLSFIFYRLEGTGALKLYLLNSKYGLSHSDLYYIEINNWDYGSLYRCGIDHYHDIEIVDGIYRTCSRIMDLT